MRTKENEAQSQYGELSNSEHDQLTEAHNALSKMDGKKAVSNDDAQN